MKGVCGLLEIFILLLLMLIYLDLNLKRMVLYVVLFTTIVCVRLSVFDPILGGSIFLFGAIAFPLLMFWCIKHTEHHDEPHKIKDHIAAIFGIIFAFVLYIELQSVIVIIGLCLYYLLINKNLIRAIVLLEASKNSLLLISLHYPIKLAMAPEILIEFATFLPLIMLAYLTVMLYKAYRSMNIWQVWK